MSRFRIALPTLLLATIIISAPLRAEGGGTMTTVSVPAVTPLFTGTPPNIDGKLDDVCWKRTARVGDFVLNTNRQKAKNQTAAYICYDARNLYIAFECLESRMDKIKIDHHKDGQPVWQDDSVEVFIAPYSVASSANYHHFAVNAAGAKTYLRAEWPEEKVIWQAAVTRQSDRWFVEMAIPFSSLQPHGKNEDCWRINFCREEYPTGECSSWAPVPTWFKSYWAFGKLLQPENGAKFITLRSTLKPAKAAGDSKGITQIEKVPDVPEMARVVIPQPFEMHNKRRGSFVINRSTRIIAGEKADETDMRAAEEINQEVKKRLGFELKIERAVPDSAVEPNCIIIGEPQINSLVKSLFGAGVLRWSKDKPAREGYIMDVDEKRIVIAGNDQLGAFWGAQTLREMIRTGHGSIPATHIIDKPSFAFRGVHLLASKDALEFHTKLIEEVFSRYKVNHIVLQTDKIDWTSHPEVRDDTNFMPREDVKKLIQIAKKHHITVTPLVQTLGHVEWVFKSKQNLSLAEDPDVPYALCPSNPGTYDFLFEIIDEAYELFEHPPFFHAGLDEFDMRGRFPVDEACSAVGKHDLFYRHVLRIHNHLKRKGCRMMMWGDILTTVGFKEKIDKLPRDIIINDWRYGPLTEYPSVDFFKKNGFETVGCTWYDPKNIYNFSRYAVEKGADGMMQTTWTGFKTEDIIMKEWPEQVYAYILSAAWAWNARRPTLQDINYEPDAVYHELLAEETPGKTDSRWFSVNLESYTNISTTDSGRRVGWLGLGRNMDLRNLPTGLVNLAGVPYRILDWRGSNSSAILLKGPSITDAFPSSVEGIKVGSRASALYFLHTTAYCDGENIKVGEYRVRYQDGSSEKIDLIYAKNISAWNEELAVLAYGLSWRGRINGGEMVRLRNFVWKNPFPEKTIEAIDFVSSGTQAAPVLLAITGEITGR